LYKDLNTCQVRKVRVVIYFCVVYELIQISNSYISRSACGTMAASDVGGGWH